MNARLIERTHHETVVEVTVRVAVDHGYYGHDRPWEELASSVVSAIGERAGMEVVGEDDEDPAVES
jgi:hypothetical protein